MRFSFVALATLLPAAAFGAAMPGDPADAAPTLYTGPAIPALELEARDLEKRSVKGHVNVDGLRYRTCPRTSCTAVGQYSKGTKVNLVCYTRTNTTTVKGDKGWGKLTNGYWVALANGAYVGWAGLLPPC
ncbi:hypothetical protein BDV26DRAFT_298927 [Aspergillus bertholletiae]|uniref:SH3 domain-containing protein n=1 Tax=Aspergillus bertholletiae TaxID=1226010 RepID=A0A5N7AQV2_9EURO|nr:hypothetical protein BDV26DRAFT_298927 [Aspergillus bertholletiae]